MYRRHTNATALSSSPVVSALGSKSDNPGKTVASYKVYTAVLKAKSS